MHKESLIKEINRRLTEMRFVLEFSGKNFEYLLISDRAIKLTDSDIQEGFDHIDFVYTHHFVAVRKIWDLQSPDVWFRYKTWNFGACRELKLLMKALAPFKKCLDVGHLPKVLDQRWVRSQTSERKRAKKGTAKPKSAVKKGRRRRATPAEYNARFSDGVQGETQ